MLTGSSTLFLSGVFCRCEDGAFGRGDQTAGLGMLFGIIHHREWEWWLLSPLSVRLFLLSYYGTILCLMIKYYLLMIANDDSDDSDEQSDDKEE